jgi:flap endonuclease-1
VLEGLGLTREQFIDMCILCGCDYCPSIKGIGAKTALTLIQKHGSIEKVLEVGNGGGAGRRGHPQH